MSFAEVTDMKPEAQIKMLKDLCKQISELSDGYLEGNAEILLDKLVDGLEECSQEDGFGTEGWEHFFGYE